LTGSFVWTFTLLGTVSDVDGCSGLSSAFDEADSDAFDALSTARKLCPGSSTVDDDRMEELDGSGL